MFAFDLYDKDCSGFLGLSEIERMVHDIYGKHAKTNNHAKRYTVDKAIVYLNYCRLVVLWLT